ncbi:hypothetical protein O6H91_03G036900 [Diphasiastrum complanatum]|uniref:Uncharacterized protein n=1 Tax=Diphasiastrum complanatum TaxID=34168 RepID=A0ACC2E5I5_DIPCM|nr:hypothetical protein O6H91_03G036900 [Diphasiastrum complanatum]
MALLSGPLPECPSDGKCLEWARRYLKDCVCTTRDKVSFVLGLLSVLSWGVAEVPQIITHCKEKSTEGISLTFLMTWLIGDMFNLVGCYLEPATLPTQFYMALLYTITTVILLGQVVYYDYMCKRWKCKDEVLEEAFMPQKPIEDELASKPLTIPERPEEQQGTPVASRPMSGIGVPTPRQSVQGREWYYTSARSLASSHTPTAGSILSGSRGSAGHGMLRNSSPRTRHMDVPRSTPTPTGNPNSALVQTAASSFLCIGGLGLRFGSSIGPRDYYIGDKSASGAKFLVLGARKFLQELHESKRGLFRLNFQENGSGSAIGELFGWLMAAIYMGGRIPQIWLNYFGAEYGMVKNCAKPAVACGCRGLCTVRFFYSLPVLLL